MQKLLLSIGLLFCASTIAIHADRINHYGPAQEIFVYALDSLVKEKSPQGIEKMTEQMLTLRKPNGSISLDGRTVRYIDGVHEQYRKENDEEAVRFMAPFLFASGRSFIDNLGQSRKSYEWATKKDTKPCPSYIAMRRSQMEGSQWDMDAALRGRRIVTQDIMHIRRKYLKESFPYLPENIQTKILEEAEASFCSDCKATSDRYDYFGNPACEDFYEKLVIMREAHKEFKEGQTAEEITEGSDTAPAETGTTPDSAGTNSEPSAPQNND